jgi:transcriptional regulator with XRE-family HTH domain
MSNTAFSKFFYEKRLKLEKTLRQFCAENSFDPGNISKLERGLMPPPEAQDKLTAFAKALGLKKGSPEWQEFFDLADLECGRLPRDLADEKELLAKLPVLFRGIRGEKLSPSQLQALVEKIKKA